MCSTDLSVVPVIVGVVARAVNPQVLSPITLAIADGGVFATPPISIVKSAVPAMPAVPPGENVVLASVTLFTVMLGGRVIPS